MEITQNDDIHNKIIIFFISLKGQIELQVEQEKKIQSLDSNYIKVQFGQKLYDFDENDH